MNNEAIGSVLALSDLLDDTRAVLTASIDGARARGALQDVIYGCGTRAEVGLRAGDLDEAEADAREAIELAPSLHLWIAPMALATLVDA